MSHKCPSQTLALVEGGSRPCETVPVLVYNGNVQDEGKQVQGRGIVQEGYVLVCRAHSNVTLTLTCSG